MTFQLKVILVLCIILAISLSIASYFGAFIPATYEQDAPSMAAQGIGQDMVDLFLVVPLLLSSLFFMLRNNKSAHFILTGTLFYVVYSFFIYSFGVHFNQMFLIYCLTLGVSLYAFILMLYQLGSRDVENWFKEKLPVRSIGILLIVIAVMFYLLWLKDVVPAILAHTVPPSISNYNLLVNPVHVLDLAIALPGLIIAAILLMKKNRFGFILAPVFLVFIIILTMALAGMVLMLNMKAISDDTSLMGVFIVLAIISAGFLFLALRNIKAE
ncbi:hypothetical protein JW960_20080 [candidate division KSB1 bacterium]|nr:hypothetical protein [candidate division KSB1 bacterium]